MLFSLAPQPMWWRSIILHVFGPNLRGQQPIRYDDHPQSFTVLKLLSVDYPISGTIGSTGSGNQINFFFTNGLVISEWYPWYKKKLHHVMKARKRRALVLSLIRKRNLNVKGSPAKEAPSIVNRYRGD